MQLAFEQRMMLLGKMVVPLKAMVLALMQTVVGLVVLAQMVMALQRTEVALAAIVVAWRPFEILYSINNITSVTTFSSC